VGDDNRVRGVDIRLLGGPAINAPKSAVSIDYQTLVNDGLQGSMIIARESILFANDNAARVLGHPSAQSLIDGGRVSDIFSDPEHREALDKVVSDLSISGSHQRVNLLARSRTGRLVRLIARVNHVQWGASRATLLSFVDVALGDPATMNASLSGPVLPAQQMEELKRLRLNEMRYRHYASAAADFFWELDSHLVFRVVSEGLADVLGMPRELILGRSLHQLLDHPANINEKFHWDEHFQQLEQQAAFRDFEFRWSVDGDTRVIRYSGIPVFNRAREFVGYRGAGCDVTASVRQAETTAYHANHDALTGLVNRRAFESKVQSALEASRQNRQAHALCFMDLDSFNLWASSG